MSTWYAALAQLNTFKSHAARVVRGKIFQNHTARNAVAVDISSVEQMQIESETLYVHRRIMA